ncbi:MAG: hypothetical protein LUD38_04230, partial [Parabacteroides sp.]|nr:hypothetical protein [Parabacteroides sp.]
STDYVYKQKKCLDKSGKDTSPTSRKYFSESMYRVCEGKIYFPGHFLWFFGGYKGVRILGLFM